MKNLIRLAAVSCVLVATGCANNTAQIDEAKAMARDAQRSAAEAKEAAAAAQRTADQALEVARDAQSAANSANEKVDRAFKKSMEK